MLETDSDRLESLKALGELVQLDGRKIWGVFETPYIEILADPGIGSANPEFQCRSIDVTGLIPETVLERTGGETYRVHEIEPDGTGMTTLRLRRG